MLTEHLHRHRHYHITPLAQWVTEGGEPPTQPHAPCDERCWGCTLHCPDEGWVTEYRRLRRSYPVIKRLERLLELQIQYVHDGRRWKTAICGTYLTPWDLMEHGDWPALAEAGVAWLASQCHGEVPVYQGAPLRRVRYTAAGKEERDTRIIELRVGGASYHRIASEVGCSKSTVRAVLAGQMVRRGRAVAR